MDKFDRIQQLHRLLRSHRRPVALKTLAERMECTEKTVRRTIDTMQCQLDAPIEFDELQRGWFYDDNANDRFELPGLWLTTNELQSLGLLLNLLHNIGPGLLNEELGPVEREIDKLLQVRGILPSAFREHIRVLPLAHRPVEHQSFQTVSDALLHQRQLDIRYISFDGEKTERRISPQTLVHYRENWYLDAWCHLRNDLRSFHLSRIDAALPTKAKSKVIHQEQLQAHFAGAYGIFSGKAKHNARLRFGSAIAREIACQQWHPDQQGEWNGQDYLLSLPYSDDRELIGDILRHGTNVRVEAPTELRDKIQDHLQQAIRIYQQSTPNK